MIQEFLNEQFIQTTDDTNFEKLKKACADVVKKISKDRSKISSYTLVAFDPEIPANNPDLLEVKQIIIDHWSTFVANSNDTAVTFIRAVMLEALQTISKEGRGGCLIWFTGRNIIKHYKLGREKDILTKFMLELANKIESEVSESWSFSPDEEIKVPEIVPAIIEKGEIETILRAATIHNGWAGEGGENPTPQTTGNSEWGKFFSARAGKGITDTINKVSKKQVAEITASQKDFIRQNSLLQMRTQLLWWKEASYSPSIKSSYGGLRDGILQTVLAYDYSSFIPLMYPISVDYFLKETHKLLSVSAEKKVKISDILKLIEAGRESLKSVLLDYSGEEARIALMNFIAGLVHEKYKAKQFKNFVGIPDTTELSFSEFTIWLFHDFHSAKITIK